jgi:hypothetical protein
VGLDDRAIVATYLEQLDDCHRARTGTVG